jgi:hypothetical protein
LSLPANRQWAAASVPAVLCIAVAIPWVGDIRNLVQHDTMTLGDLMSLLFEGFGALIWSVAVMVLLVSTLALVLHRDEFRAGAHKLAYVVRFGPLRLITEYQLVRISRVRTGQLAAPGLTNICLEYDGVTAPFGRALPAEALARALEFIRSARASEPGEAVDAEPGHQPISAPTPAAANGDALDTRWPWLSPVFLIGANLIPLIGVLLFDWDLAQIMVLFWAENAVVGVYALLKLAVIQRWGVLLLGPLFLGHFGGFMAIHFMFVYQLFVRGLANRDPEPRPAVVFATLFAPLWSALLAMLVSHGVSFFDNFIGRREYLGRTGLRQMAEPYRRVLVLHFTLILGGFAVLALGQPIHALLVLVAVKIAVDLHAHARERGRARRMPWDLLSVKRPDASASN